MPLSKVNRPGLNTGIADSSDATAITINSSEQVGIGATSVDQLLHLETNTNTRQKIETTNSGSVAGLQLTNTAITAEIGLETSNDAGGGAYSNSIGGSSLHILNNNNSGIVMDTSGRVTMPNQPSFMARRQGNIQTSGTVVFNQSVHNVGNHYSTTTGGFTAPISGRYLFAVVGMAQDNYFRGQILKNGSGMTQYRTDHDGATGLNYAQATITVIFELAANDIIKVTIDSGNFGGNTAEVQFFGQLLS